MIIRVLTVEGQPEFVSYPKDAQEVDEIVQKKYGRQPDGRRHNWEGIPNSE